MSGVTATGTNWPWCFVVIFFVVVSFQLRITKLFPCALLFTAAATAVASERNSEGIAFRSLAAVSQQPYFKGSVNLWLSGGGYVAYMNLCMSVVRGNIEQSVLLMCTTTVCKVNGGEWEWRRKEPLFSQDECWVTDLFLSHIYPFA